MRIRLEDVRGRGLRLGRKYWRDFVRVGPVMVFCLVWGMRNLDSEASLSEMFLVPMAPGFLLWAVAGRANWFFWGCGAYVLPASLFGVPGWVMAVTTLTSLGGALAIGERRGNGWTWRGTLRRFVLGAGRWLQLEVAAPQVGIWKEDGDRENTAVENAVVWVAWGVIVVVSITLAIMVNDWITNSGLAQ